MISKTKIADSLFRSALLLCGAVLLTMPTEAMRATEPADAPDSPPPTGKC